MKPLLRAPAGRGPLALLLAALLAAALLAACEGTAAPPAPPAPYAAKKVLRYAFVAAETTFDPARISDLYSRYVAAHIFEAPLKYDYLARPPRVVPDTAAAMPEVSADYRTWTVRIQPGIYFSDDPAFKGKRRELTAADYVYSFKRFFDPAVKSPGYTDAKEQGVIGLDALRQEALAKGTPFDYDREVEGIRALDRYTLQFKLAEPRPRFLYRLADNGSLGAVAREVVQAYGEAVGEHPVGTGPFVLAQWRRSSFIALDRNPGFRELHYDAHPAADDAQGQALLARFKGRRLPMIDRVEISIIDESQPRWLAFLNDELDVAFPVPPNFIATAAPGGRLAPNLARRGMHLQRMLNVDYTLSYFNMQDATVGGYTPDKVALRRALSLAFDVRREIDGPRNGQGIAAESIVVPGVWGYDPALHFATNDYRPARARALLDLYGYVDRDGDGWREQPDGSPLVIRFASSPGAFERESEQLWRSDLTTIGVRFKVESAQWPEQLKAARAGELMMWSLGQTYGTPDVQGALTALYGPAAGGENLSRFALPAYDALYRRTQALPDGPERLAALREMQRLAAAYAPQKMHVHRILNDITQPWLLGFRRPLFGGQWWQYVDIDAAARAAAGR